MDLKKIDKKSIKIISLGLLGIVVLIILFVVIKNLFSNHNLSYSKIENKLVAAAENYYKVHEDELPNNGENKTISVDTLVESEKIKSLDNYISDNVTCNAEVKVYNNDSNYLYIPALDCGDEYKTNSIKQHIINSGTVDSGDGLYQYGDKYIYRGEYVNNYVKFAGKVWRIVSIDNIDNTIRLVENSNSEIYSVFDDRYNISIDGNYGFNKFEKSRMLESLQEIYNDKDNFSEDSKQVIIPKQLCVGSRSINDVSKDGSTECSTLTQNKYPLGLIQVNELLMASIDQNCNYSSDYSCTNYNYFDNMTNTYWTITPSNENDYDMYYISSLPMINNASEYYEIKLAIYVNGNVRYTKGDGTEENPYVIK